MYATADEDGDAAGEELFDKICEYVATGALSPEEANRQILVCGNTLTGVLCLDVDL